MINVALANPAAAGGNDWIQMLMPLAIVFAVMYFMVIRPQNKKAREHQEMLNNLRRNDKVLTNGGIVGKVSKVGEQEITVEIASGVEIQVLRSAISQVLSKTGAAAVAEDAGVVTPLSPKKPVKKASAKKTITK